MLFCACVRSISKAGCFYAFRSAPAYVIRSSSTSKSNLSYLPLQLTLPPSGEKAVFDFCKKSDEEQMYRIFKHAVDEGRSYPHSEVNHDQFREYFLPHHAFVLRSDGPGSVMGTFYVKPNFPGRSSHICHAGFLIHVDHRRKGIGRVLLKLYLRVARDLGFEGSFFNLVYASNVASLKLCREFGFTEVGTVPKAGKLKDLGYVDAVQFYYDLTTLNENGEPACGWPQ